MPNWVQSDCIMVQFVFDVFHQLYTITSDLIFQLYKGVTPVKLSKEVVWQEPNVLNSVEIEIKQGFEKRPRVSATLRLFRK